MRRIPSEGLHGADLAGDDARPEGRRGGAHALLEAVVHGDQVANLVQPDHAVLLGGVQRVHCEQAQQRDGLVGEDTHDRSTWRADQVSVHAVFWDVAEERSCHASDRVSTVDDHLGGNAPEGVIDGVAWPVHAHASRL